MNHAHRLEGQITNNLISLVIFIENTRGVWTVETLISANYQKGDCSSSLRRSCLERETLVLLTESILREKLIIDAGSALYRHYSLT